MAKNPRGRGDKKSSGRKSSELESAAKKSPKRSRASESAAEQDVAVDQVGPTLTIAPGPRKTRSKGRPAARLTTHKTRAKWFQSRASWPVREARIGTVVRERERVQKASSPAPGDAPWQLAGPSNIGGRVTCLACDPANPERLWAGAAGGGVWFSPDAGMTW